jgi:hypothetical protein
MPRRPPLYFLLEGHRHRTVPFQQWHLQSIDMRRVAEDTVDGVWISTVFTGLNTNLLGTPMVFETMVFTDEDVEAMPRISYPTWEDAEAGHAVMVELVRRTLHPDA